MPIQDFFAFCTSLNPIELRALGTLSESRHVAEGQTIYTAGEAAETLYIINRGVIEIMQESDNGAAAATYLTRGDIFGDVEVLTGRSRLQIAKTQELVSLRCFNRQHFPELQRRVPSFFRYLCGQLAERLIQARDAAIRQSQGLELGGSLTKFDLVTIFQTIVHSSQTGELSIANEAGELIGMFAFAEGQPLAGRFQHLQGEEAFWQLFLAENLRGKFSFASLQQKESPPPEQVITRKAEDMLLAAIQARDEFQPLKEVMDRSAMLKLRKRALTLPKGGSAASRSLAEKIWRCCAEYETPLSGLYPRFPVCELKIYQAVQELINTGHLTLSVDDESQKVA